MKQRPGESERERVEQAIVAKRWQQYQGEKEDKGGEREE